MIEPGATIGILGGGQLGRMLAQAAATLGYRCHIYCPETESPAAQVAAAATVAAYDDASALQRFAREIAVATYEFENIPIETVARVAAHAEINPGPRSLEVAQNRVAEKDFVRSLGIGTADYAAIADASALPDADAAIGRPAVLKTQTLGYDGKGQRALDDGDDLATAWETLAGKPAILERRIAFAREVSVIVARSAAGDICCFDPAENRHRDGILDVSTIPAALTPERAAAACAIGETIAEALGHVGVLCVELFDTGDGPLLVNEIAPRVHNSGHWTIEACATSQFAQHIRAICGLPLGSGERIAEATMTNLIGSDVDQWPEIIREPGAHLHLYGKAETRASRKMGHVTRLYPLGSAPGGAGRSQAGGR